MAKDGIIPGVGGVLPLDGSPPRFPLDEAFVTYNLDDRAADACEWNIRNISMRKCRCRWKKLFRKSLSSPAVYTYLHSYVFQFHRTGYEANITSFFH